MSFFKKLIKFIILSTLLIYGVLFYIKNINSNIKPQQFDHSEIKEEKIISQDINVNKIEQKKRNSLSPLDEEIHAVFQKDKDIKELLKEISDSTEITFILPKDFSPGKTDLGIDVFSIRIKDILEIFLSDKKYIWFSKDTDSIIILEK